MTKRGGIGRPFVSTWADAELAELERLWLSGEPASAIGRALGRTKNSVIGKVHRLKLPPRPSPIKPAGPPPILKDRQPALDVPMPPARSRKTTFVATRPLKLAPPAANGKLCLWPMWPDDDEPQARQAHEFCGEPRQAGSSYCEAHHARSRSTRGSWGYALPLKKLWT